jgi:hypothetical protein
MNIPGGQHALRSFLCTCTRLPARLSVQEAAILLGFNDHDVRLLVAADLLKPLGDPAKNSPKFFAAVDVVEKAADPGWLSKATKIVARHWKQRNAARDLIEQ